MKKIFFIFTIFTVYLFALNSEVRFDMLTVQLKKQITKNDYKKAIHTFEQIRQYKKKLPISYDYYEGKANFEAKNYDKAYILLDKYVSNIGRNGKYYKSSLPMLIDIEDLQESKKNDLKKEKEIKKRDIFLDVSTGLMWQNTKNLNLSTFKNSQKYCSKLNLMAYNDWYLPNLSELKTIINNENNTNIKKAFKNITDLENKVFWANTTNHNDLGAWTVDFSNIYIEHISKSTNVNHYTRCVRNGH